MSGARQNGRRTSDSQESTAGMRTGMTGRQICYHAAAGLIDWDGGGGHGRYQRAAGWSSLPGFLDRRFGLTENGTTIRTEFVAGVTTFLTMVYIVFVNPEILASAGMDRGAVFVATCLAAAISTLIMALYANYPIALAPGMGLNAFFAFVLVLGAYKYTWQQALALCSSQALLVADHHRHQAARIHHHVDSAEPEARGVGRRRPVPRHHRAPAVRHRRRPSGDAGDARQSAGLAADPRARGICADRGAELAQACLAAR